MVARKPFTAESFLVDVSPEPNSGCWLWVGSSASCGYGLFNASKRMVKAHRAAYELFVGSIPIGLSVCHRCDNRICVNPDHLWIGTHAANMADMSAKKRWAPKYGKENNKTKLTESDVIEIRARICAGERLTSIARSFNVSDSNVQFIRDRKTWAMI